MSQHVINELTCYNMYAAAEVVVMEYNKTNYASLYNNFQGKKSY